MNEIYTEILIKPENLYPLTVETKFSTYQELRKDGSKVNRRVPHPIVKEYVDVSTGEILSARKVLQIGIKPYNYALIKKQQVLVLSLLRKEVLKFANFLLMFRNKRRGISPDLDTVCKWYADAHGMRKVDVGRYIKPLKEYGILASDTLMGPLFQIAGKNTTAVDHLSEDVDASRKYDTYLRRLEE
jgi:hypothetical protein